MKIPICLMMLAGAVVASELDKNFESPPPAARPWCYWWWLNGAASKEGITRDFEEMRKQGIGGALHWACLVTCDFT
jgi:hypothetical protein